MCINDKEIFNGEINIKDSPMDKLNDISTKNYDNFFKFNNISLTFTDINKDRCYYYSYEIDNIKNIPNKINAKTITLKSYNDTIADPSYNSLNPEFRPFFEHFVKFHVPEELLDH